MHRAFVISLLSFVGLVPRAHAQSTPEPTDDTPPMWFISDDFDAALDFVEAGVGGEAVTPAERRAARDIPPAHADRHQAASLELGASVAVFAGGGASMVAGVVMLFFGSQGRCVSTGFSFGGDTCAARRADSGLIEAGVGLGIAGGVTMIVGAILTFGLAQPAFSSARRAIRDWEAVQVDARISDTGGELLVAGVF